MKLGDLCFLIFSNIAFGIRLIKYVSIETIGIVNYLNLSFVRLLFIFNPLNVISFTIGIIKSVLRYLQWSYFKKDDHAMNRDVHPYIAPTITDARSPCPFLNILANHGYISRDGRAITLDQVLIACKKTINLSPIFNAIAYKSPLYPLIFNGYNTASGDRCFDLDALAKHNFVMEHDASLTRSDYYERDPLLLDQHLYDNLINCSSDGKTLSTEDLIKARIIRENHNITHSKHFSFGLFQKFIAWLSITSLIVFFSQQDKIPLPIIRSLFFEEKFPDDYVQPATEKGLLQVEMKRMKIMDKAGKLRVSWRELFDTVFAIARQQI